MINIILNLFIYKSIGSTNKNAAGYYLYETNLYEYKSGENKCTKVDEPVDGYYWNDHQYNQLVECINGSCKAFTPKLKGDTTDTSNSDLLIDTGYNINFDGESLSSMLFKQSNEDYQYKVAGHPNTVFADPEVVYNIKVNKNSVIIDVNGSGKPLLIFIYLLIYIYYINYININIMFIIFFFCI